MAGRDHRLGASPSLALDPPSLPPASVPACGGTTRAYRAESCIPRATRGLARVEPSCYWEVYASTKRQFPKALSMYNRSIGGCDVQRS